MKSCTIRHQQLPCRFTPGPWENLLHGHISSSLTGKLVAKIVDSIDTPLAWAVHRSPHLRANTQLLIAYAPTLLKVLVDLMYLIQVEKPQGLFTVSKELQTRIEAVLIMALGGSVDANEMQSVKAFMHHVAIDQSLLIDHVSGPWDLFGPGQIRSLNLRVAETIPDRVSKALWAADGDASQMEGNQKLIAMTLPLAVSLMLIVQNINLDHLNNLDPDYTSILFHATQINNRLTVPHFQNLRQAA